jgi:hypothetical protein
MIKMILLLFFFFTTTDAFSQSKSINRFRARYKESSGVFFYSSTLKMLNMENNPEFAAVLDDIEEIRVLNYDNLNGGIHALDISKLKNDLQEEDYSNIMMIHENGSSICLYNHQKRGISDGFVAIIENNDNFVLIDLIGKVDMAKFLELKKRIDIHKGESDFGIYN